MMIKICGITNEEDAFVCVEAGASAIGFNFFRESPRYITPEDAALTGAGLPVLRVGVFVNETPARTADIARLARLDVVQLHGDEDSSAYRGLRLWKAFRVTPAWSPDVLSRHHAAEAFLLDGPTPGSGQTFDWSVVRTAERPIILAGGLGPDNVALAIRQVHPWGIDACSKLERAPGIKDHEKVARFIKTALSVPTT